MITTNDLNLIIRECEIQMDTSPASIAGFAAAYGAMKYAAENMKKDYFFSSPNFLEEEILTWAEMIYPEKNKNGYRNVPVVVGGSLTPPHSAIPHLMADERRLARHRGPQSRKARAKRHVGAFLYWF